MRKEQDSKKKIEITEQMKELVLAKIDAQVPSTSRLFMGSSEGMNKEQIMDHVRKGEDIGNQIVLSHIRFMRAVASGEVTKAIASI